MNNSYAITSRSTFTVLYWSLLFLIGCSQNDQPTVIRTDNTVSKETSRTEQDSFKPVDMAWIPGGSFNMGSNHGKPDELPVHKVTVDGFWINKTEVTNYQFAQFVNATKYLTIAEQKPNPLDFPGVPEDKLTPGAVVFEPPPGNPPLNNHRLWWTWKIGASWKHPKGPNDSIEGKNEHPVVNVCWFDALEYSKWLTEKTGVKHRLPTEAEWEYAARGGANEKKYIWGDELKPNGQCIANFWQGRFPNQNTTEDGFRMTSPVGQFASNGYGLYDMAGNVWEWCGDWYKNDYYEKSPNKNPQGPNTSFDPAEPNLAKRITRGGSFLCSELYCTGYRPSARMKTSPDTGLNHTGFRLVAEGLPPNK